MWAQKQLCHEEIHLSLWWHKSCVPGVPAWQQLSWLECLFSPVVVTSDVTLGTGPCESCNFQEFPETCEYHLLPEFFLNCPLPETVFQLVQHNTVPRHFRTGPQIIFYSEGRVRALTGKMRLVLTLGKTILVHNKDPMRRGRKKYKISNGCVIFLWARGR